MIRAKGFLYVAAERCFFHDGNDNSILMVRNRSAPAASSARACWVPRTPSASPRPLDSCQRSISRQSLRLRSGQASVVTGSSCKVFPDTPLMRKGVTNNGDE